MGTCPGRCKNLNLLLRAFLFHAAGVLVSLIATPSASAAVADELNRFAKCHLQFTGEIVSPDHKLLASVRAGMSGIDACTALLKSGNLVNGLLASGDVRVEGKKILHTFNILNNSFFANLPKKEGKHKWIYDSNDRSYYLLNAMFSTDTSGRSTYPIQKIFTDATTYRGVRDAVEGGYRLSEIQRWDTSVYGFALPHSIRGNNWNVWYSCPNWDYTYATIDSRIFADASVSVASGRMESFAPSPKVRENGEFFDISGVKYTNDWTGLYVVHPVSMALEEGIAAGQLVGLEASRPRSIPNIQNKSFGDTDGYWRNHLGPAYQQPYPDKVDDLYDNLGAGILFTPNYQETLGMDTNNLLVQNGVNLVARTWAQDVLKDFLCRDIPVIRVADAIAETEPVLNQAAPFRSAVSCMRCHSTMDNLAFISRNYQYSLTSPVGGAGFMANRFHTPALPDVVNPPAVADQFFPVRPARGKFRYRDYSGNLHDLPLVSSASDPKAAFRQFARHLSGMDDPYACIAGKYFKYFTGIQPKFSDPGDPDAPVLSARDKALQEYVLALGKYLKDTGDLQKTILDIVSSQLFVDPLASTIK